MADEQAVIEELERGDQAGAARTIRRLLAALAKAETREREQCINEACLLCAGRYEGWSVATRKGPGLWVHLHPTPGAGGEKCLASATHERAFQEEEAQQAAAPEKTGRTPGGEESRG